MEKGRSAEMQQGKRWIHMDAQFPLDFGRDLLDRFGPAGELLFIQFLCACKRSFPQGQVRYRTEEEARVLLGAPYPFVHSDGSEWTLDEFWKWCSYRRVTTASRRNGRRIVTASRWNHWEIGTDAERKRRSRAKNVTDMSGRSRTEVEGEGEKEVEVEGEGDSGGGGITRVGPATKKLLTKLDEVKTQATSLRSNGHRP